MLIQAGQRLPATPVDPTEDEVAVFQARQGGWDAATMSYAAWAAQTDRPFMGQRNVIQRRGGMGLSHSLSTWMKFEGTGVV